MTTINAKDIHKLVVACDAGMGSSVMLASQLRKQLKNLNVVVGLIAGGGVPVADLITHHLGLEETLAAFELVARGEAIKVTIEP